MRQLLTAPRALPDCPWVSPPTGETVADEILSLELALARRDFSALEVGLEAILDDGFIEFGASGRRWDRATMIETLRAAPATTATIEAFEIVNVGPDVVLALYDLRHDDPDTGDGRGRRSIRSSTWVRRDGRWKMRFHQGTLAAE